MNRMTKVSEFFPALVVIAVIMSFMLASGTQAQWPFSGINGPWYYGMPSFGSPFLSFGQIPAYSYNNTPHFGYNSFLTPGLPPSSRSYYNNPTNYYANPYGQTWFDNSDYTSRSYTSVYSNFQPPPLGTPRYTNWASYGYDVQPYPWRFGSGPPLNITRAEPEPIDITADTGKWESQELTDAEGNKLTGSIEYNRSDGILKMTDSSLPLGEGFLTAFQYTPTNGSAPISFKAGFDSAYTAVFTGTAKNSMAVSSHKYAPLPLDYFVVEGNYVVRDSSGQVADTGEFNM
ncbi:MAG: hypothetical protein ACMUIL_10425 [bacterium]